MIPISKPILGQEEEKAVLEVLKSGMLAQGERVERFENEFSSYIGVKYAVAVANGTAALFLALLAHGIGKGDEVVTTPFSFISSANSILFVGAKPVFVDIDSGSFNINPDLIEPKITKKTRALLVVHLFGNPCQMDKILKIVKKHKLILIEDACQSHGAEFNGRKIGSLGTGCFSFYATKNMTTGEGGMVTTNNKRLAEKIKLLRNHGSKIRYYHNSLGFNLRMTDIQAAIGIEQLRKLNEFNKKRIRNALYLNKKLAKIPGVITPKILPNTVHTFHQYTIKITQDFPKTRDELVEELGKKEIHTGIFYPIPIHKQKVYKNLGYKDILPVAETLSREVVSLPVHPGVNLKDLRKILRAFLEIKTHDQK